MWSSGSAWIYLELGLLLELKVDGSIPGVCKCENFIYGTRLQIWIASALVKYLMVSHFNKKKILACASKAIGLCNVLFNAFQMILRGT